MGPFGRDVSAEEVRTIILYGFAALVLGGGAGMWVPLVIGKSVSGDALGTYIYALAAPFYLDVLLREKYWEKIKKEKRISLGVGLAAAAALALAAIARDGKAGDIAAGVFGTLIILVVWFVLAVYSERFVPDPEPRSSMGGREVSEEQLGGGGLK
jgi:peptidoglycan/LPS O-acetylase OafA/YrhL